MFEAIIQSKAASLSLQLYNGFLYHIFSMDPPTQHFRDFVAGLVQIFRGMWGI